MTVRPLPHHLLSLDEWDALPEDRFAWSELVEGVLVTVPRPAAGHQAAIGNLYFALRQQLPPGLVGLIEVETAVDEREPPTVRVPDLIVAGADVASRRPRRLAAADVLVAVEVVSPGTGRTDRVTKLSEYAEAGIPNYWIVELDPQPRLTVFRLKGDRYEQDATGTSSMGVTEPTKLTLDVAALTSWN